MNIMPPLHERKAPLLTTFWRRFRIVSTLPARWGCIVVMPQVGTHTPKYTGN